MTIHNKNPRGSRYVFGEIKIIVTDFISEDNVPTKEFYMGKYQLEKVGFYQSPWYSDVKILHIDTHNIQLRESGLHTFNFSDSHAFKSDIDLLSYCFGNVPHDQIIYHGFGEWVSLNKS